MVLPLVVTHCIFDLQLGPSTLLTSVSSCLPAPYMFIFLYFLRQLPAGGCMSVILPQILYIATPLTPNSRSSRPLSSLSANRTIPSSVRCRTHPAFMSIFLPRSLEQHCKSTQNSLSSVTPHPHLPTPSRSESSPPQPVYPPPPS